MKKKKTDESVEILFISHPLYQVNSTTFALEIEKVVKEQQVDYWDAVNILCEKYDMEYESIPKLLTKTMKQKIEMAAKERNLLK